MKTLEESKKATLELLKGYLLSPSNSQEKLKEFEAYLLGVYKRLPTRKNEELKGVIIACASFLKDLKWSNFISESEEERLILEFKIEFIEIFLSLAKEYFYILE
jgi:hypothetical protein